MLMRHLYVTLSVTIGLTLLIRECSTGYNYPPFNQSRENYWGGGGLGPGLARVLTNYIEGF